MGGPFDVYTDRMRLSHDGKLIRTDIWREGDYLDLWSVPHFLSGMVVAFALYFFGFEARSAFVIAFLLLIAYEMFEVIAEIDETRWNRTLDVVVGMVSFTPTFLLAPQMGVELALYVFICVTCADGVLSFLGWRESQKAAVLEEKLRAEMLRERQRFAAQRAVFSAHWHGRRERWRNRRRR